MRGVILAGGSGSRLFPLTKVTNKHLLPVGNKPMIYYSIEKLVECGIKEILIITGIEHAGSIISLLGSGKEFNCNFTYKIQDEAGGIAQALGLAECFAQGHSIVVLLGDNIFGDSFKGKLNITSGAKLFLKEVENPCRYGVAEFLEDKIINIEEKPKAPKTNYAVTGIYVYDKKVFDYIKMILPSGRGELEITDVNNFYVQEGNCSFEFLDGFWTDAGTFESLLYASRMVSER